MTETEPKIETEEIESRVWKRLVAEEDPEVLESLCTALEIQVQPADKGKRNDLFKLVLKFLNSETVLNSDDHGWAHYLKIDEVFSSKEELETHNPVDTTIVGEKPGDVKKPFGGRVSPPTHRRHDDPFYELKKIKELKINGKIGGVGEKDRLSYVSLSYQISNAKKLGYSDEMIFGAVIKAITPGTHLRTYLESKQSLTLPSLMEVMRSHFQERDSSSVFSDLCNAGQAQHESCLDFVMRVMCLREKVIILSAEEGCPYDVRLVSQKFAHTVLTGLRNNNIRSELRSFLKTSFSDDELFKAVTEAVTNEHEFAQKTDKKTVRVITQTLDVEKLGKKVKKNNVSLPQQIEAMQLLHEQEMSVVKSELHEIKVLLLRDSVCSPDRNFRKNDPPRFTKRSKRMCENCAKNQMTNCYHCFHCGSPDHRMAKCPEN